MKESIKKYIAYSIWIAIILFILRSIIAKQELEVLLANKSWLILLYSLLSYAGESIAVTSVLMTLFNSFLWKTRIINRFVDVPVLANSYFGYFVSDWYDMNIENECSLEIKQTYLSVSIVFKTKESRSISILSSIETEGKRKKIVYTYQNEPRAELSANSPMHKGTVELWIEDNGCLSGNYYTSRKTSGSMYFKPYKENNDE